MNKTLLVEIGTEELPPKALLRLSEVFAQSVCDGLSAAGLTTSAATPYATPRRLAVSIPDVGDSAPDQTVEKLGPAVDKAFDAQGAPTPAAAGFARSCGVAVTALEQRDTEKGPRLAYSGVEPGQSLSVLLTGIVANALKTLPIPKRMRWGDSNEAFVRPVHNIVALHGDQVIAVKLFACAADRTTFGHRFHCDQAISLPDANSYRTLLREPGYVIADFAERRGIIREQVIAAARELGGEALIDAALLDEVTALVEWPVALAGSFGQAFLQLPREVLIATLQGHQRYFPVENSHGNLLANFVTVANIQSKDPAQVIAGNERVVKPRLSDALFFWQTDLRRGLESYAAELGGVSFERALGSVAEKSARVASLAGQLADSLGVDAVAVARAAALAKADLLSEMVGEFPELQGTMGRYYAAASGEPDQVAQAIGEQYAPRQSGAAIPASSVGRVLALADKLDTLAGIFSIGKRPSGDKDPFALRRAALGVLRILLEAEMDIELVATLSSAVANQPVDVDVPTMVVELRQFLLERLRGYLADQGVESGVFESVSAAGLVNPQDFNRRILAVRGFLAEPEAQQLSAAHKRIRNILKNNNKIEMFNAELLSEPAEQDLFDALQNVGQLTQTTDYGAALHALAALQQPVDRFFDDVLVMSDNPAVRDNRLALLAALDKVCCRVADISKLSVE